MSDVLILNRRCIRHSQRGGAERCTWEIARGLVEAGYKVEWFSSLEPNLPEKEQIHGVRFIRRGNELTVHLWGFLYARKHSGLIIDEFNGMGFFTWNKARMVFFIHQLYENFWNAEFGVAGYLFRMAEKMLVRRYRKKPAVTVSKCTADDLRRFGFTDVAVIHNGIDIAPLAGVPIKNDSLTLVYLGRIKKTKNPEDAVLAFLEIKKKVYNATLLVIGEGPMLPLLKKRYGKYESIRFLGYVDGKTKYDLLRVAHFLLVPSLIEGWGLVVTEANAMGTPAIGYRVKGLRSSILDGVTGVLVESPQEMADAVLKLWNDEKTYRRLCENALSWARNFSWERTKAGFINFFFERGLLPERA